MPVEEIEWIDASDNYLRLHAGGRSHLDRGTMRRPKRELDPVRFVRIHRSAIVAIDQIAKVSRLATWWNCAVAGACEAAGNSPRG